MDPMLAGDGFANGFMRYAWTALRKSGFSFLMIWLMRCLMITKSKASGSLRLMICLGCLDGDLCLMV